MFYFLVLIGLIIFLDYKFKVIYALSQALKEAGDWLQIQYLKYIR